MKLFKPKLPPNRSVLFVCTANVTRSPAAAALFRKLLENDAANWRVGSAGVEAVDGDEPHAIMAVVARRRWNVDLYRHRSRRLDARLLARHRWILVMETRHRDAILKAFPALAERVWLLRAFGRNLPGDDVELPDPTGMEADDYNRLLVSLEHELPRVIKFISQQPE